MSHPSEPSLLDDVARFRQQYVERYVSVRVNRREGDFTVEELYGWEAEALRQWRDEFPAMTEVLIPHG